MGVGTTCPGSHEKTHSVVCSFIKSLSGPQRAKHFLRDPMLSTAADGNALGGHTGNQNVWWYLEGREISCRTKVNRQEGRNAPGQMARRCGATYNKQKTLRPRDAVQPTCKALLGV